MLAFRLGGPVLLHALNKCLGLPSVTTVLRAAELPHVAVSYSGYNTQDVLQNISSTMPGAETTDKQPRVMGIDEVALNPGVR